MVKVIGRNMALSPCGERPLHAAAALATASKFIIGRSLP
jgi:hypothetical protein